MTSNRIPAAEDLKPKHRSNRHSPFWLFLVAIFVALACSWFAIKMHHAKEQKAAVRAIRELGGQVWYGAKGPPALAEYPEPSWLRTLVGVDFLVDVYQVSWHDKRVTDSHLQHLGGVPHLFILYLDNTQITDAGLEYVGGLTQLTLLSLDNTSITDAGLDYIKGLTQLGELHVKGTKVTDHGAKRLKQALPHCMIER